MDECAVVYLTSAMKSSTACVGLNQAERMDSPISIKPSQPNSLTLAFRVLTPTGSQSNGQTITRYAWLFATQRNVPISILWPTIYPSLSYSVGSSDWLLAVYHTRENAPAQYARQ